jgi:molybdopterin molybdotransferase
MILVEEAEKIILSQVKDFGTELISFEDSLNRILAEDLLTDRDLPPFNRATLDGIAINYSAFKKGIHSFHIKATQAAGEPSIDTNNDDECIEIMTGAALPGTTDTVIGYENIEIKNGSAFIKNSAFKKGQGIHYKGVDKRENEIIATASQVITPVIVSIAASIGKMELLVKKLPRLVIISSGDELVDVHETPNPYQVRRSNSYIIKPALKKYKLNADVLHIPDNPGITKQHISDCLKNYDIIILSGGISMGKFDYIPAALEELAVEKLFHKVQQRPGKPFWFGRHQNGVVVFALPGNPVSAYMCLTRYCIPWLKACLGLPFTNNNYAILNNDFSFGPSLQYFLQVKLNIDAGGKLLATPFEGNGSGDFANLAETDAFMELPLERNNFTKGEAFPIWPFKEILL